MRRHQAKKRTVAPDPRFSDAVITRFINVMMWDGKRAVSAKIFYGALEKAALGEKKDARELFHEVLGNIRPNLEVRSRRVGGATYPVPVPVRPERAEALAIRWVIQAARGRSEKTMTDRLAAEFRDAAGQRGGSFKKKTDIEKMADANRAFSHYRF